MGELDFWSEKLCNHVCFCGDILNGVGFDEVIKR